MSKKLSAAKQTTRTRKYRRWAIAYKNGLYVGQWLTRRDAIFEHCRDVGLSWETCRKRGDRAIVVWITHDALRGD